MLTNIHLNDLEQDMILRDRILMYIFQNPAGTSIIELEKEFGDSRMLLGYVLNNLHEEKDIALKEIRLKGIRPGQSISGCKH